MKVRRKNPDWIKLFENKIASLREKEVAVGFPANKGMGTPYYPNGASVLEVAVQNNYGVPPHIPARPFMDISAIRIQKKMKAIVANDVRLMMNGNVSSPDKVMKRWGVIGKSKIQKTITDYAWIPNAPSTIAMKGSSRPLIDTGHMRQSVTYVVRKKGA